MTSQRTPEEQRQIALKEIRQAMSRLAELAEETGRMAGRLAEMSHEFRRIEDNASAGGVSWLELSDADIAKSLAEDGI
jgi:uncharacterized protein (DUF885 family)